MLVALWMLGNLRWIRWDHLVRDGDEEGHVGAAELFLAELSSSQWIAVVERAWWGDMGEYPPGYAAFVGAWWWLTGVGQPSEVAVRGIGLFWILLAALATARLGSRRDSQAALLAGCLVLVLPLCVGLGRHFMPEGALIAAVSVSVLMGVRASERPTPGRALGLGLVLGLGLMVKQTFLLVGLVPTVWAGRRLGRQGVWAVVVAGLVAGPWYLAQWSDQLDYASASASNHGSGGLWGHLVYYPVVAGWYGLGPVLLAALVLVLWVGRQHAVGERSARDRELWMLGWVWFLGALLLLGLVPKKYPRLLAPALPGLVLVLSVGVARIQARKRLSVALVTAGGAWLVWVSSVQLPVPTMVSGVDPGCLQSWIRPAVATDLALGEVAEITRSSATGPVRVHGAPEIACEVQTTHPWLDHLGPYLRRAGVEREIQVVERSEDLAGAAVAISWDGAPSNHGDWEHEQMVPVDTLGRVMWIGSLR
ncbi:MAG: glycosyltransferase family 39 protein [Myxococcota bacterium]|nr:glycosyltransferase family 39 protein [Myxococcota bacterium]